MWEVIITVPLNLRARSPALRECGECQVTKFWPQILHHAATTSHIRHWFGRLAPPPAGQRVHNGPSIWRSSLFIFHQCQLDFCLVAQFATTSHMQIGGAYCRAAIDCRKMHISPNTAKYTKSLKCSSKIQAHWPLVNRTPQIIWAIWAKCGQIKFWRDVLIAITMWNGPKVQKIQTLQKWFKSQKPKCFLKQSAKRKTKNK